MGQFTFLSHWQSLSKCLRNSCLSLPWLPLMAPPSKRDSLSNSNLSLVRGRLNPAMATRARATTTDTRSTQFTRDPPSKRDSLLSSSLSLDKFLLRMLSGVLLEWHLQIEQ